ncbi:MAG: hypothetical protein GX951_00815 [Mollicutes bacterium]|nr:hypothetical protein [Mollicutes bacterium]
MNKEKSLQVVIMTVLAVAIIIMSVGFAALTSQLNIAGNVTVKKASYNVHFDTNTYALGTGSQTMSKSPTILGTSVNYDVTLNEPGEFVEFSINVVNEGTIDAYLKSITMTGVSAAQDEYIDYTVTYAGTEYTSTNTSLNTKLAGETGVAAVKVRVEYVLPANASALPTSDDVELNLTCVLNYSTDNT